MCCSDINTFKGGMVTVVKNYLESREWKSVDFIFVATHKEGSGIAKAVYFLTAYLRIMKLLLSHKVDMAHLHMAERGSFYRKAMVERLCHRFHIPVILHHHSAEFEAFYHTLSAGRRKWVKKALEEAELNLVLSSLLAEKYREKAPGAKIEVLYNAVNVPEENPYTGNASDIILLGKLGQRKGTYDFLQALKAADDKIDHTQKAGEQFPLLHGTALSSPKNRNRTVLKGRPYNAGSRTHQYRSSLSWRLSSDFFSDFYRTDSSSPWRYPIQFSGFPWISSVRPPARSGQWTPCRRTTPDAPLSVLPVHLWYF